MNSAAVRPRHIQDEMAAAAKVASRDAADIRLIAVCKRRSVPDIEELIDAGQVDFGESRVQEAQLKWPELVGRHPHLRLHCIGRLQSNKAAEAIRLFDVIHSVDRRSLLDALVSEGQKADRFPSIYLQVNIGEEEQKGGCPLSEVADLVEAIRNSPLPLAGLMAIPPLEVEPAPYFALLAKLARRHDVTGLSMGMSSDFPTAIRLGATTIRVGTALFEG